MVIATITALNWHSRRTLNAPGIEVGTGSAVESAVQKMAANSRQRQRQVDHQAVGRNPGAIRKPAGADHEPADRALQPAEQKQDEQPRHQAPFDGAGKGEPQQRQQEHHADEPPPGAVQPFQPEDLFEPVQVHARVQQRVLWNGFVFGE